MPFPPPTADNLLLQQFIEAMPEGVAWSITNGGLGEYVAMCEGRESTHRTIQKALWWIAEQAHVTEFMA